MCGFRAVGSSALLGGVDSTLKCNTQLFANAEVARLVKISICNLQKQLGQGMVVHPGSKAL